MKKFLSLTLILVLALSFTAFAADFTCLSTSVANGANNVYTKEGSISFEFSDNVDAATLTGITMKKGEDAFADFTATAAANVVTITFANDLDYSTYYEITYAALKSSSSVALTGTNKLSFTTDAEPEIQIEAVSFIKGIGTASLSEPANLSADGSLQGMKVSVKNISDEANTVNIVCALYNANGMIKKVIVSEKTVDAISTEDVFVGTVIDASYAGGCAKVYVWDSVSNKSPFVASSTFTINP